MGQSYTWSLFIHLLSLCQVSAAQSVTPALNLSVFTGIFRPRYFQLIFHYLPSVLTQNLSWHRLQGTRKELVCFGLNFFWSTVQGVGNDKSHMSPLSSWSAGERTSTYKGGRQVTSLEHISYLLVNLLRPGILAATKNLNQKLKCSESQRIIFIFLT